MTASNQVSSFFHPTQTTLVFEQNGIQGFLQAADGYIRFSGGKQAGSVGQLEGEALQACLQRLQQATTLHTLILQIDSAGARFDEAEEGLLALNNWLESLWQTRQQGTHITVYCPNWMYGGMAMALSATAHRLLLGPSAQWGLLGPRAYPTQGIASNSIPQLESHRQANGFLSSCAIQIQRLPHFKPG